MPENWKTYKLEEILEALIDYRGKTPKKTTQGIPLVTAKIVKQGRILEAKEFIAEQDYEAWMRRGIPEVGDVVLTTEAPLGEVAQIKDSNIALAQRIVTLRGKKGILDSSFLKYFLQSNTGQSRLEARQSGTTVFGIKQSELRKVLIDCPPYEEQKSIASILSALDEKIELNLQMNKTLEEMAMALYKHWFVDFGPFQDGEFVESELGEIPKGWEVKTIGELYNTTSGGTPSRKKPEYYEDGDINWVKSKELYGNFIIDTEEKINSLGLKKSSAKIIPPKSVLLAMYGATVGESSILSIEATCNQAICAILEKELSFIYVFLYLRLFKTDILNQATGSAQQNISQQIIKNIPIISPPVGLQIFKELEDYYNLIEQNVFENKSLTQFRDTLLPKLVSGEVRVKDVEKTLSEVL